MKMFRYSMVRRKREYECSVQSQREENQSPGKCCELSPHMSLGLHPLTASLIFFSSLESNNQMQTFLFKVFNLHIAFMLNFYSYVKLFMLRSVINNIIYIFGRPNSVQISNFSSELCTIFLPVSKCSIQVGTSTTCLILLVNSHENRQSKRVAEISKYRIFCIVKNGI